ncbi:hypothetical protein [Streptomyces sp. SID2888]|uniref:hypothetical protein n=1 Tax=Streptomyces sp. SID2888 TaxID=2690256 RepID=UPI001F3EE625|nr:hypothetical protein [Streptomyces sp. SID2888]
MKQHKICPGRHPGTATEKSAQIKALKKEYADLKQTNETLKTAGSSLAAELYATRHRDGREGALRDTRPVEWFEQAQAAEQRRDWDAAIALVSAHAECYSTDPSRHDSHLWHMDLLARAERLSELTEHALTDVHARRRLNASLHERGMEAALRNRAEDGDHGALYALVRLLCETSRAQEAHRAVQELGPDDQYAHQIVARFRSLSSGAQ